MLERLRPSSIGIIARTAAEGRKAEELKEDIDNCFDCGIEF